MPKDTDLIVRVARTCSFLLPPARQQQISRINEVTNAVQGTVLHGQGARRDGLCFHVIYWSRRDFNKRLNTSSNQVFTVKRSSNRSHCPFPSWRKQSSWASSCPAEEARVSIVPRQYRVSRLITDRNGVRTDSQMLNNIRYKWSWIIFALRTRMIFKSNTWSFSLSIQGWNSGGGKNKYSSRDERSTVSMPRLVPRGGRLIHVTKWLFP